MAISGFPIVSGNNGGGGGTVTNRYAGEWDLSIGNTVPNDAADGKVYEIVGANGVYLGNELNQGDFVEFADNLQKLIVISKPKTTTQIEQIAKDSILVDLQSNTSNIYVEVSSIATVDVIDTVNNALQNNASDTYSIVISAALYSFSTELLNNTSATYSSVYGIAYQAITTGDGNLFIQTSIEDAIKYYADGIGVGGDNQPYHTVIEAAQATISSEIQSGGIIDTAIQAAINP